MRITILVLGSRGDIQPFVPLGKALVSASHYVRIATFKTFQPLITEAGLDFYPIRGDAKLLLINATEGGFLSQRINPLRVIPAIRRSYGKLAASLPEDLSNLKDTDLVLNQLPAHLYGGDLAEYIGARWAIVSVIPLTRTRHRPMIGSSQSLSFLPGYNLLTYRLGEQLAWQLFRGSVNRLRTEVWKLPAHPFLGPYEAIHKAKVPVICGFSEHVVPREPDWGDNVHITGWWYPEDSSWRPSKELIEFLEAGPPPVFVGFGSMLASQPEQVSSVVIEAVRKSGQRAILHAGWAGLGGQLPSTVFPISYAPYEWLFPRMSAVVHHGGSGTSGFSFRSGVPSIIVPFGFDQFYWGDRARELGVGPEPLPFRDLSADLLADAIQRSISSPVMRSRAAELGRKLSNEDGVGRAAQIINSL
ncbi:MAG: glycosyltransferase [Anaerolineales bacterium]|nr:glycosyltransferase [Anaerolineales bacterium]